MIWLNVDKPLRKCTIHQEGCSYLPTNETAYKGIGTIKRDGGWFNFENYCDAERFQREQFADFILVNCSKC